MLPTTKNSNLALNQNSKLNNLLGLMFEDSFFKPSLFSFIDDGTYDIYENETTKFIDVMAPGLIKSKINLNVKNQMIEISYENKDESKSKLTSQSFTRQFSIPENSDIENIRAKYIDGIIKIEIPLKENQKIIKQIQIE